MCLCIFVCVCARVSFLIFFFVGSLLICWCMCLFGSYLNVTASHSANLSFSLPLSVVFLFSIHRSWFLLFFFIIDIYVLEHMSDLWPLMESFGQGGAVCVCVCVV